jgi:hypothetical protein
MMFPSGSEIIEEYIFIKSYHFVQVIYEDTDHIELCAHCIISTFSDYFLRQKRGMINGVCFLYS